MGKIVVEILECKDLHDILIFGMLESYVKLQIDQEVYRTAVAKGGNPQFHQRFLFRSIASLTATNAYLSCVVWEDENPVEYLGKCKIPLVYLQQQATSTETTPNADDVDCATVGGCVEWFPLLTKQKNEAGMIKVKISWLSGTGLNTANNSPNITPMLSRHSSMENIIATVNANAINSASNLVGNASSIHSNASNTSISSNGSNNTDIAGINSIHGTRDASFNTIISNRNNSNSHGYRINSNYDNDDYNNDNDNDNDNDANVNEEKKSEEEKDLKDNEIIDYSGCYLHTWKLKGHRHRITCIAISPDGSLIATGSVDKTVRVWRMNTNAEEEQHNQWRVLKGHVYYINSVAFSPSGRFLVSASDKTIKKWNPYTGEQLLSVFHHAFALLISPDDEFVIAATVHKILVISLHTGAIISENVCEYNSSCFALSFAYDYKYMISGHGSPNLIKIWNFPAMTEYQILDGFHTSTVQAVALSPNNKLLASGSYDTTINVFDATNEFRNTKKLFTINGHKGYVYSLSFSTNSDLLASGSADGTIKLWRMPNGELIRIVDNRRKPISGLAFSPKDDTIVSCSLDTTVMIVLK